MTSEAITPRQRGSGWMAGACLLSVAGAVALGALDGRARAQEQPKGPTAAPAASTTSSSASSDPRVGLKAGFKDAGTAARNLELIASLPRPDGFFNLQAPSGNPVPPESPRDEEDEPDATRTGTAQRPDARPDAAASAATPAHHHGAAPTPAAPTPAAPTPAAPTPSAPASAEAQPASAPGVQPGTDAARARRAMEMGLAFVNTDLAFHGTHVFLGNFNGFNIYNLDNPKKLKLVSSIVCPGGQGDLSIHGNLLVMSVEQTRGRLDCGTQGVEAPVSAERFRGVRIFDISDLKKPKQLAAVQTCRGSHTHTLVTNPRDPANLYIYGSGTSRVRSDEELSGCSDKDPKEDPNTALFSIDVIQVPLAAPDQAKIVNRPRIFADEQTGALSGLWQGGNHGTGTQSSRMTNQCHDITVFPEIGLAAGACSGNGILLDVSDPVHPKRLDAVTDKNFAYWHSATFNNDGTKVIFTDEWGGGVRPRCRATDQPNWGADAIFNVVDRKLQFAGYFKMPAPQTDQENCVAHNGSLIPVPGRDIMVQAWYQGGVSVFDFSDPAHPQEIAFFDRGPLDAKQLIPGGYWSTYWYNGLIYGSELARGIDVFKLKPSEWLTQNEIDAALLVRWTEFNPQEQPKVTWPAVSVVARAYVDQLTRSQSLTSERVAAVDTALRRADKLKSANDKDAAAVATELDTLATQIAGDAGSATGRDAARLRSLASTMKGRAAALR